MFVYCTHLVQSVCYTCSISVFSVWAHITYVCYSLTCSRFFFFGFYFFYFSNDFSPPICFPFIFNLNFTLHHTPNRCINFMYFFFHLFKIYLFFSTKFLHYKAKVNVHEIQCDKTRFIWKYLNVDEIVCTHC